MGTPPQIELANLGMADSLILMVLALVVAGPRRLPQIGRQIGKLMYEFRKASNDFKFQMEEELRSAEEADRRKKEEERLRELALKAPPAPASSEPAAPAETAAAPPHGGSPFREDVVYPPSAPAAEREPSDTTPRIQPPATGEPVPAAHAPNAVSEASPALTSDNGVNSHSTFASGPAPEPESAQPVSTESSAEAPTATEQAAHHG
jgi:sec-independent protein translocase protein TatB